MPDVVEPTKIVLGPMSDWFKWEAPDVLGLYPFEARCLAVDWTPDAYPELLELGRGTIDFVFGKTEHVSRQIRGGEVTLYMPERWLSVHQKAMLMQALCDLHENHPLKRVNIVTSEPIIISDFTSDMVRVIRTDQNTK